MVFLIKAKCNSYPAPFCYHYGVQFYNEDSKSLWITDNTPEKGVSMQSMKTFMQSREIISATPIPNITTEEVIEGYKHFEKQKYNYWNFSCKQYAMLILKRKKGLSALQKGAIGAGVLGSLYYISKSK